MNSKRMKYYLVENGRFKTRADYRTQTRKQIKFSVEEVEYIQQLANRHANGNFSLMVKIAVLNFDKNILKKCK